MYIYVLPDGRKFFSGHDITSVIGEDDESLCQFYGEKSLKDLPHMDTSLTQIETDSGETFIPVSIEDVTFYWKIMAHLGNEKASDLMYYLDNEPIGIRIEALGISPQI